MKKDDPASGVSEVAELHVDDADPASLRAEIARLRARVAELEGSAAQAQRSSAELHQSQRLLEAIVDNSAAVIFAKDVEGRHLLINRRFEALFHVTRAAAQGKTDHEIFPPEVAEQLRAHDTKVREAGTHLEVEEVVPHDDGPHTYITVKFPIYTSDGAIMGTCGIATDVTERKRAEQAKAELQRQIIESQEASLRELSTPLIPLSEGALAMPLIGAIDSARTAQIMETLLQGVTARRARIVILDVTGVKLVDAQAAAGLMRVAHAARLLGAEVILTGISPPVATSLITLGVDLGGVRTLDTLQSGIAYALRR